MSHTSSELAFLGIMRWYLLKVISIRVFTFSASVFDFSNLHISSTGLNNGTTIVFHISLLPSADAFIRYGYSLTNRKFAFFLIFSNCVVMVSFGSMYVPRYLYTLIIRIALISFKVEYPLNFYFFIFFIVCFLKAQK